VANTLVQDLVEAGIHFGQRVDGWNPKMRPYIYGASNGIHIIDIKETIKGLLLAKRFITNTVLDGKDVCFVGTKPQAKSVLESRVPAVAMHYVSERWLGGMLTNFRTIRLRVRRLEEIEAIEKANNFASYSRRMEGRLRREKKKIQRNLQGVRSMVSLPGALVVIDTKSEITALREARKLGIPTICLVDTDGDPDAADIAIPGNDDSMRSIDVIVRELCLAVAEGLQQRAAAQARLESAYAAKAQKNRAGNTKAVDSDASGGLRRSRRSKMWVSGASGSAVPLSDDELLKRLLESEREAMPPMSVFAAVDQCRDHGVLTRSRQASIAFGVVRGLTDQSKSTYHEPLEVQFIPRETPGVEWSSVGDGGVVQLRLDPYESFRVARLSFVPHLEGHLNLKIEVLQSYRRLGILTPSATVVVGSEELARTAGGGRGP
jgi:small subunit ribosomal protein S2